MPNWLVVIGRNLFGVALYALSAWVAWRLLQRFPWEYDQFEIKEGLYALAGDFTLAAWSVPGYAFTLIRPLKNSNSPARNLSLLRPILSGLLMGGGLQIFVCLGWIVNDWWAGIFIPKDIKGFVWLAISFILAPLSASLVAAWVGAIILRNKILES
ncbi:hypothetical protein GH865_11345 [Rhodocyclus tenuis]|uniref:hypothetical protein n=1 Tax=Rhodocyclus gracilis TaxID=2929842 RepID=UPI0012989790|nr:hypothetical protein [Rhodocyclus gracilis]MRD73838.1 hypothetical protein [Rhodocyclus gracilis]